MFAASHLLVIQFRRKIGYKIFKFFADYVRKVVTAMFSLSFIAILVCVFSFYAYTYHFCGWRDVCLYMAVETILFLN